MDFSINWFDGGRVGSSSFNTGTGSVFTSTYSYDGLGRTTKVVVADGRHHTVSIASSLDNQILSRRERSGSAENPEDAAICGRRAWGRLTQHGTTILTGLTGTIDCDAHLDADSTATPFRWTRERGDRAQMGRAV